MQPLLSILVCSLESRVGLLATLVRHLTEQLHPHGHEVELLVDIDNGEKSVGGKRNDLLERSKGRYVAFVDDDDWVPGYYVSDILTALHDNPDIDCLGLRGVVAVDDGEPAEFVHSMQCKQWYQYQGVYYRTPNHLNPVRREIALDTRFPDLDHGEDHDYSRGLNNRIKTEVLLPRGMYHYASHSDKSKVADSVGGRAVPRFLPPAPIPSTSMAHPQQFEGAAPPPRVAAAPVALGPFPPTTITTSQPAPSAWQVPAPVPVYAQPRVRTAEGAVQPQPGAPRPADANVPVPQAPRPAATSPPSPAYPLAKPQPVPVNPTGGVWPPPNPTKAVPTLTLNPQAAIAKQLNTPSGRGRRKKR